MKHRVAILFLITSPLAVAAPETFDGLTFHAPPKPLPAGAVTEDWPRFLGPRHDLHSRETKLLKSFPDSGPKVVKIISQARLFRAPETWGIPTVCRGLLYVNQNAMGSRLICYDLRG